MLFLGANTQKMARTLVKKLATQCQGGMEVENTVAVYNKSKCQTTRNTLLTRAAAAFVYARCARGEIFKFISWQISTSGINSGRLSTT